MPTILQRLIDTLVSPENRLLVVASAVVLFLTVILLSRNPDRHPPSASYIAREPPRAPSGLPIINHTIPFLKSPSNFYKKLRDKTRHPQPYTVTLGSSQKFYIFNGPNDASQVLWRNSGTLDFYKLALMVSRWVFGGSKWEYDVFYKDVHKSGSFMSGWMGLFRSKLADKTGVLKVLNIAAAEGFSKEINGLIKNVEGSTGEEEKVDILKWLKTSMFTVALDSIWGPLNPMRVAKEPKKLADAYYTFEDDALSLIYSPLPSLTHRKCLAAREFLVKQFESFLDDEKRLNSATEFIQARKKYIDEWKLPTSVLARGEVILIFAALSNTLPVCFWCIYNAFRNPTLLNEIRDELEETSSIKYTDDGEVVFDMNAITTQCRLLRALWDEVLRFYQDVFFTRTVTSDTVVTPSFSSEYGGTRSYLLKKGNVVQVPISVVLTDPLTWGDDGDVFDPYRFLEQVRRRTHKRENSRDAERRREAAFKPFGGGGTHCPGRFFAWTEVACVVASLVGCFDIDMPEVEPSKGAGSGVRGIENKKGPVWTSVKVRKEVEGKRVLVKW